MPTATRSGGLASIALAITVGMTAGLAACSGSATPPPTGATPNQTATPPSAASGTEPAITPAGTGATPGSPSPGPATPAPLSELSITAERFSRVSGAAIAMAAPDDGTGRLLVANQAGKIYVVNRDGSVERTPFVDMDRLIRSGGEQGLLGLALHPAFPTDPRVFVDYTNNDGDTVIASIEVDRGDPNRLDADSLQRLLFIDQPYANHNGGSIQFGPNGYLTIAMGDGGLGGDPHGNGQNTNALLGKILRIDVDGARAGKAYGLPPENPFVGGGGAPEVWLAGMRNPWRTSFDRQTGDFWIGDVGQAAWEEIDVVRAGSAGLINFGWNVTEGAHCYRAVSCNRDGLTAPVSEYGHDLGCSVVGGYVYRGSAYPILVGRYLFSDNCTSRLWVIDAASDGPSEPVQAGKVDGNVSSFGEDADGELYVLTLDGLVYRLVAEVR